MTEIATKPSLSRALNAIAEILAIAEEGLNTDEAIKSCLDLANRELSDSIDRRVFLVSALSGGTLSVESAKGLISSLKTQEEAVYKQRKMLEVLLLKIKETTKQLMEDHGQTVIDGKAGGFRLQGGQAVLECDVPVYSRSYSNLITADDSIEFKVPSEYLIYEHIATLNKEIIKSDLLKGGSLPWARLQHPKQIRMKQVLALK